MSPPESEKLIALSTYFNVSVDYLIKEEIESTDTIKNAPSVSKADTIAKYMGLGFCILGFICLIAWSIVMIADPEVSNNIANSSMITIYGRGILLIACFMLVAAGMILLFNKQNRR